MKQLFITFITLISLSVKGQSLQIAQNYLDRSDYKRAVPLYEKIATEAKRVNNIDTQVTAQNGLADCYLDLSANYKAMSILKQNIILLNKPVTKNFLLLAKTHQLLAICYDKLYLIEDYLTETHTFYSYYKKAAPDKEIYRALYYAYLGRYYNMRYSIDKAFYYTNTALQLYHKHKNKHLVDDYIFYNAHLFTVRNRKENIVIKFKYVDSLQYFINKRYPYDNLKKSRLLVSIAAISLDLSYAKFFNKDEINYEAGNLNADKAIGLYSKGILINNRLAGYYYAPSAYLNSLKGLMYFYKKDYVNAIANYDEGIKRLILTNDSEESNFNCNPILIDLLNWKAWCLDEMYIKKKDPKLLYEIEKTLLIGEKTWSQYMGSIIKNKQQYNANIYLNSPYNSLTNNYYKLYEITNQEKYIELYYEYDQKSKYTALLESLNKEKEKNSNNSIYTNHSFSISLEDLVLKINNKIPLHFSKQESEKRVRKQFKNYYSFFQNLYRKNLLPIKKVQNKLEENEAILSYNIAGIQTDFFPFVLMISKKTIKIINLKIDGDVTTQDPKVISLISSLNRNDIINFKKEAFQYYRDYFKPIEMFLPKSITNIQVIPNSNFSNLPFDMLLTSQSQSNDFSKLPYLIKKYQFSYILSSSISNIIEKKFPKSNNFSVFNPNFYSNNLSELKESDKESKGLSDLYNAHLIRGKEATKKAFSKHIENDRIVVLLSHGKSSYDENESNKGIYLSDGFLSLDEVYNLQANCDFLLLGACETGVGFKSREGNINLARAFTAIGVKSMMVASWKIDEKSSTEIISSFFKYLDKGCSKSEALQKAKLDYLTTASTRMANPSYWAGLNITGNDDKIELYKYNYWYLGLVLLPVIAGGVYYRKKRKKLIS